MSLLCFGYYVLIASAALACLALVVSLSGDAERLFRIWRVASILSLACIGSLVGLSCAVGWFLRRVPEIEKKVQLPKSSNRIIRVSLLLVLALLFLYPPRLFVYFKNGRWISRSKAGSWEVSRAVVSDALKRNITWACAMTIPLAVGSTLAALALIRATRISVD
jgi:hypothetical protein